MTNELHPELGSGALREALELHEYRNGLCTCGQFVMPHYSYGDLVKFLETHPGRDIRWRYWLDHFAAALSLSSPIEPPAKVFKTDVLGVGPWCVEFPDGEIVTTRSESRANAIARAPQASSEVREAAERVDWMQVLLNLMNGQETGRDGQPCFFIDPEGIEERFCLRAKFWAGHDELHKFVSLADLLALAPSRQGAGR